MPEDEEGYLADLSYQTQPWYRDQFGFLTDQPPPQQPPPPSHLSPQPQPSQSQPPRPRRPQPGYPVQNGHQAPAGYHPQPGYQVQPGYQSQPGYQARPGYPGQGAHSPKHGGAGRGWLPWLIGGAVILAVGGILAGVLLS
jgi:hypothetical protein